MAERLNMTNWVGTTIYEAVCSEKGFIAVADEDCTLLSKRIRARLRYLIWPIPVPARIYAAALAFRLVKGGADSSRLLSGM